MTEPNEGIMSKIMKLLERANHPETPPHEALLAEQMAENLMAKHMIDRFEAEQAAKRKGETVRRPVQNEWEMHMTAHHAEKGTDYASGSEFDHQVIDMMKNVLKHCNVRVHPTWKYAKVIVNEGTPSERLTQDVTRRIYTIVGFPEDIAYAERIWFNVFRTFVQNINPQWDKTASLEYNAYNFASAGVSWKNQVLLAETAGDDRLEWPWRYQGDDRKKPFYSSFQAGALIDPGNDPWGRSIHKLKRACKKYSDEHNVAYPYAGGAKLRIASRSNFAQSYHHTISKRLVELREEAGHSEGVSGDKFALAIRDTEQRVDEEFYRLFPEYDPENIKRRAEEDAFARACSWAALSPEEQAEVLRQQQESMASFIRQREQEARRARRSYGRVRENPAERYDAAAWERGRKAANTVNLRADAEVKTPTKREIGS